MSICASALPPDVGGGYAPPKPGQIIPGYAPGSGLALRIYWAKGRTKGIAQKWKGNLYGGAEPQPHIRRQSRNAVGH